VGTENRSIDDRPRPARILLAKPGLDGHDRGVKILAHALRDAGLEVVYTGLHQSVAQIVVTAVEEDVDMVGVSLLSGAHMRLIPELLAGLAASGAGEIKVVVGGFIPQEEDRRQLRKLGAAEVFDQDLSLAETVAAVKGLVQHERAS
jgi:methylmalonyl-CoA mutase, C-terminal domain